MLTTMKKQLLFVDDEMFFSDEYRQALQDRGFEVTFISLVDEAVALMKTRQFHAAVLDLKMSHGNCFTSVETHGGHRTGLVFARWIRQQYPNTQVALLTADNSQETLSISEKGKFLLFLKDRLNPDSFAKTIDSLCADNHKPSLTRVEQILKRFHLVAMQLSVRRDNRETLLVRDEYDVQNLLHALLLIDFQDVRPEEWTPSYAGSSSRMDFLLKGEEIVIETKYATPQLKEKKLGEQLILDVNHYAQSADCNFLFCFVYDPQNHILNRESLRRDLEEGSHLKKPRVLVRFSP